MKRTIIFIVLICLSVFSVLAQDTDIDISGSDIEYITLNIDCDTNKQCFDAIREYGGKAELARCNLQYHQCEFPTTKSKGLNLSWQLIALIIASLGFIGFLVYLEYKKPKEKKRFTNPLIVTIIAGTFLSASVLVIEVLGFLPSDWAKEHPWIFPALFLMMYLATATILKSIKPLSHDKLKEKAVERLWEDFNARLYHGAGYSTPWVAMEYSDTTEDNKMLNKVVNFLITGESATINTYLLTLSIIEGEIRREIINPTIEQIQKIFSKEITANLDFEKVLATQGFLGEVEDRSHNSQQPQNP